jgi:hypothetical protein
LTTAPQILSGDGAIGAVILSGVFVGAAHILILVKYDLVNRD